MVNAPAKVVHDDAGMSEVDHHVSGGEQAAVIAVVDLGRDVGVRGLRDHADDFLPHPPPGSDHADLDHRCPPPDLNDRGLLHPCEGSNEPTIMVSAARRGASAPGGAKRPETRPLWRMLRLRLS